MTGNEAMLLADEEQPDLMLLDLCCRSKTAWKSAGT